MPYALFCDDAKISRTYASEARVWKHARESGLVIDIYNGRSLAPHRVLDNGYEIRECRPDPGENLDKNEHDAEAQRDYQLSRKSA